MHNRHQKQKCDILTSRCIYFHSTRCTKGKDLVREFYYDTTEGKIAIELNVMPSGLCSGRPDGPRYFEFHPQYNIAYVVNELSSTVSFIKFRPSTSSNLLSPDIC